MQIYIPIITAVAGILGGWLIRHFYDARVERSILRREIFKDYFRMRIDGVHGILAIQRAGALRLPFREFDRLVKDVSRCGHPPGSPKDHSDIGSVKDLYEVLLFAAAQEYEIHDARSLYDFRVEMLTQHPDKAPQA